MLSGHIKSYKMRYSEPLFLRFRDDDHFNIKCHKVLYINNTSKFREH